MGGDCSTYGGQEKCMEMFWWRDLRERHHLEYLSLDGRTILQWIFKKWDIGAWTGLIWLGTGTGGGHL